MVNPLTPKTLVYCVAGVFVALFAGVWVWMCQDLWRFDGADPRKFSTNVVIAAGFLATTVGSGTAAVLGFTIAEVSRAAKAGQASFGAQLKVSTSQSWLVSSAIVVYLAVGTAVFVTWLANDDVASDVFNTFALSVLGWAGGAFSSVFKSAD